MTPHVPEALIRRLYAAFNARDIDGVIAELHPDVDWPNGWEGGRLHGLEAVREYWTRQFAAIDPHVEPGAIEQRPDRTVAVAVHQTVHAKDGALLSEGDVEHVYAFSDDARIVRMDIVA
jgi:hypothetical protein